MFISSFTLEINHWTSGDNFKFISSGTITFAIVEFFGEFSGFWSNAFKEYKTMFKVNYTINDFIVSGRLQIVLSGRRGGGISEGKI